MGLRRPVRQSDEQLRQRHVEELRDSRDALASRTPWLCADLIDPYVAHALTKFILVVRSNIWTLRHIANLSCALPHPPQVFQHGFADSLRIERNGLKYRFHLAVFVRRSWTSSGVGWRSNLSTSFRSFFSGLRSRLWSSDIVVSLVWMVPRGSSFAKQRNESVAVGHRNQSEDVSGRASMASGIARSRSGKTDKGLLRIAALWVNHQAGRPGTNHGT